MAKTRPTKGTVLLLKAPRESEEDPFAKALEQAGFRVVTVPVLAFKFVNQKELALALHAQRFCGIIFTSPRAVHAVSRVLSEDSNDSQLLDPCSLRCFVVGSATAVAAKEANFHPEGEETGSAEKLVYYIQQSVRPEETRPLLYPCARMARDTLHDKLQSSGYSLEEITAYETVPSESIVQDIRNAFLSEDAPHSVVYFSPSGVQFTESSVEEGVLPIHSLKVYAIGPTTEQAIISRGYPLTGVAAKPDPASLLQLLQD